MKRLVTESRVRVLITATVGLIGAAAGFTHTHQAAYESGQHGWLAWADAVVIECMVIVAGLQLAAKKSAKERVVPGVVLVVAFLVQMGAQVSQAPKDFAGWLFAALPALGCLVVAEFALSGLKARTAPAVPAPEEPQVDEPREPIQSASERTGEVVDADPWPQIEPAPEQPQPVAANAGGWAGWGR